MSPRMSSLQPIPHTDSVKLLIAQYNNDGGKTTFRVAADSRPSGSVCPCVEDVADSWLSQGSELKRLSSLPALKTPSTSVLFRQTLLSVCRYCIPLMLSLLYNSVRSSAVINSNHILWNKEEQDLLKPSTTAIQKQSTLASIGFISKKISLWTTRTHKAFCWIKTYKPLTTIFNPSSTFVYHYWNEIKQTSSVGLK
jgi:hypothetical protein